MITQNKIKHFFALKKSTTRKELFTILVVGGLLIGFMVYSIIDYVIENKDVDLGLTQSYQNDWDCPKTNQFGTIQECIAYWDSLSELAKNEGRYEMLQKLNNDDYLSDTVKQYIFEIEGIWLFDEGA